MGTVCAFTFVHLHVIKTERGKKTMAWTLSSAVSLNTHFRQPACEAAKCLESLFISYVVMMIHMNNFLT